jgi:ABC-type Fe3+-siderophore transport system permease subunit
MPRNRMRLVEALRNPLNRPQLLDWTIYAAAVVVMVVALTAGMTDEAGWWLVFGVVAAAVVAAWLVLRGAV